MRAHRDLQHTLSVDGHFLGGGEYVALITTSTATTVAVTVAGIFGIHRLQLEWGQEVARVGGFLPGVEGFDVGRRQGGRQRRRRRIGG